MSDAKLSVMKGAHLARRSYGQINGLDHMVWYCQDVPDNSMRPPVPADWLQRRLAWPSGSPRDEATIAWMVHVRKWSLTNRYKPHDQ